MGNEYYNNDMNYYQQQNNAQQYNNNYQSTKKRGLNLYQKSIFSIYNPKNASVDFMLNMADGTLSIRMAPAIPNNPAINIRGPVPKGVKIYDWDKSVLSNFSDVDIIDFVNFLKTKFNTNINDYGAWIINSQNSLAVIQSYLQSMNQISNNQNISDILASINNKVAEISSQFNSISNTMGANSIPNQFGLYRKTKDGDKAWNFVYDNNTNMLHINCMHKSKDISIRTSISSKMALRLLTILESYVSNYVNIQMLSNNTSELSKTFAINNIFAPENENTF